MKNFRSPSKPLPNPYPLSSELGEEEESESLPEIAQRGMPPWLISLVIHLVIILVLVLIPLQSTLMEGISLTGIFGENEGDVAFEVSSESSEESGGGDPQDSIAIDTSLTAIEDVEPSLDEILKPKGATELASAKLLNGFAGRTGDMKESLLKGYGGTAGTENAVRLGLQWVIKQQKSDGSWSLRGPYANGGVNENKPAATAMALLALVGAGNTHRSGEYQSQVEKGLYYLLQIQNSEGFFAQDSPDRQQMYSQAQCTIVLCELFAMTKDDALRGPAQRAIDFAESAQGETGGWRYYPGDDGDVSVTGWFVMALMSAQMAGLKTDSAKLENIQKFLNLMQHSEGALYSYLEYDRPSLSMTAEALLCRQYLGWDRHDHRILKGAESILARLIDPDDASKSFYYWYYATQMLHHLGGDQWETWNQAMRVQLPKMQIKTGQETGSWSPEGEQWGVSGGRMYSTCFCIYCLEVYYRHLPLYDFR